MYAFVVAVKFLCDVVDNMIRMYKIKKDPSWGCENKQHID
jgi:hypothetical protein